VVAKIRRDGHQHQPADVGAGAAAVGEQARDQEAADATIAYRFDPDAGVHIFRLLDPVADQVTKNQPAVHDMLQMVRAAAAKH